MCVRVGDVGIFFSFFFSSRVNCNLRFFVQRFLCTFLGLSSIQFFLECFERYIGIFFIFFYFFFYIFFPFDLPPPGYWF